MSVGTAAQQPPVVRVDGGELRGVADGRRCVLYVPEVYQIDSSSVTLCDKSERQKPLDRVTLAGFFSVRQDGSDKRFHAKFANATDAELSPDGSRVTYEEETISMWPHFR